jgi:hypothetical protein
MVDIDVGGEVQHKQTGAKSTIGVASDQLVLYYDPDKFLEARDYIDRAVKLHEYHKKLKAGMIPDRGAEVNDPLAVKRPGAAQ